MDVVERLKLEAKIETLRDKLGYTLEQVINEYPKVSKEKIELIYTTAIEDDKFKSK